jgi:hypothetical protein
LSASGLKASWYIALNGPSNAVGQLEVASRERSKWI